MADYKVPLRRYYASYTAGFFAFVVLLAVLERYGMPSVMACRRAGSAIRFSC